MLVQLALADGGCWLIDPTAADLSPLAPVLSGRAWVAHGANNDLAILHAQLGVRPTALWDTQSLAGLLGFGFPRRLEDLVSDHLEAPAPPGATLTDWSKRPLSAAQQRYAAADARQVLVLVDTLAPRLTERQRGWWRAIGDEQIARALAPADPDRGWKRLGIAATLDAPTRQVLTRVAAWREAQARRRDVPPGYVLPDTVLLDLARRRPADVAALAENRRVSKGVLKHHGAALIELVHGAGGPPVDPPLSLDQDRLRGALSAWAVAFEAATGLAAGLSLPQDRIEAVARAGAGALDGWRAAALGPSLGAFLAGDAAIRIVQGELRLKPEPDDP
jgi:ribonuclease D